MTPVYPENTEVVVTVALPVFGGAPLIPSTVTRSVKDETGAIVSPAEEVPVEGSAPGGAITSMDITIPASINGIPGRRAARVVDVQFTTDKGVFDAQVIYLLESPEQLQRLKNSFVNAAEAQMTRRDMPRLDGWDAATEAERVAALVTAYRSLCRLTYRYRNHEAILQSRLTWGDPNFDGYIYIVDIETLTDEEWAQVPDKVREAIQRAQMAEADTLLRGDPVGDKRRAGIISETVGESSMFFRQTPEVRMSVSKEALEYLSGYIYRDTRIARG